jgi:hypothetical protein
MPWRCPGGPIASSARGPGSTAAASIPTAPPRATPLPLGLRNPSDIPLNIEFGTLWYGLTHLPHGVPNSLAG